MMKVAINRDEELQRFKIYKTFEEAKDNCYPSATVVLAVNTYYQNEELGYIVMDAMEADFRRVSK